MDQSDVAIHVVGSQSEKKDLSPATPEPISMPTSETLPKTVQPVNQLKKTVSIGPSNQVYFIQALFNLRLFIK